MHMQVFDVPIFREVIQNQCAPAFGFCILASATVGIFKVLRRPRDDLPSSVPPESLTFGGYKDMLNSRRRTICDGMSEATGDRLMLLRAELAAVEQRLSNLADSFFVLKSELAQANSALMSMQAHASQSEIVHARTALDRGDTLPAEAIFVRVANSGIDIAETAEARYRLARLAFANIDYAEGLEHLRQASELAPDDLRVNASLAELVDVLVTLVDAEPLPAAVLQVLEEVLLVQGRAAVAEQFHRRALAYYERAFGPNDPRTVRSLKSLARLYIGQQRYEEAELLHARGFTMVDRESGSSHPEFAAWEKRAGTYNEQEVHEGLRRKQKARVMLIAVSLSMVLTACRPAEDRKAEAVCPVSVSRLETRTGGEEVSFPSTSRHTVSTARPTRSNQVIDVLGTLGSSSWQPGKRKSWADFGVTWTIAPGRARLTIRAARS